MKQGDLVLDVDTDDLCIVKEVDALGATHTQAHIPDGIILSITPTMETSMLMPGRFP